jgi:Uncharacterized protein conserved in bacteria (DUF2332)
MQASRVADKINWFVQHGCRGQSPLYEALCSRLDDDRRLLEIAESTPPDQPFPHLFFAAVQSLLLAGSEHELTTYYASCVPEPNPPAAAFPAFRDFCLANSDRIRDVMDADACRQMKCDAARTSFRPLRTSLHRHKVSLSR